jgi:hypothetical protein
MIARIKSLFTKTKTTTALKYISDEKFFKSLAFAKYDTVDHEDDASLFEREGFYLIDNRDRNVGYFRKGEAWHRAELLSTDNPITPVRLVKVEQLKISIKDLRGRYLLDDSYTLATIPKLSSGTEEYLIQQFNREREFSCFLRCKLIHEALVHNPLGSRTLRIHDDQGNLYMF